MLYIYNKRIKLLMGVLDFILRPICRALSLPFRVFQTPQIDVKRILVVDSGFLGDTIISLPALKALREHYKDAEITVLVNPGFKDLVAENINIDSFIEYELPWSRFDEKFRLHELGRIFNIIKRIRKKRFDIIIDFRGDFRNIILFSYLGKGKKRIGYGITGFGYLLTDEVNYNPEKNEVEHNLDLVRSLGIKIKERKPTLKVNQQNVKKMRKILKKHNYDAGLKIVLAPGGAYDTKLWSLKNFAKVNDLLHKNYNAKVIVLGSVGEMYMHRIKKFVKHEPLVLAGETSLADTAALISFSDLVIGNDNGLMHMAAALDKPTVTIFGPTDVKRWKPYGGKSHVVSKGLPCSPCGYLHTCPNNQECINLITVEEVIAKISDVVSDLGV